MVNGLTVWRGNGMRGDLPINPVIGGVAYGETYRFIGDFLRLQRAGKEGDCQYCQKKELHFAILTSEGAFHNVTSDL